MYFGDVTEVEAARTVIGCGAKMRVQNPGLPLTPWHAGRGLIVVALISKENSGEGLNIMSSVLDRVGLGK